VKVDDFGRGGVGGVDSKFGEFTHKLLSIIRESCSSLVDYTCFVTDAIANAHVVPSAVDERSSWSAIKVEPFPGLSSSLSVEVNFPASKQTALA
jgi:hypothetical protein